MVMRLLLGLHDRDFGFLLFFCQCLQNRWDDLTWFMDTKGCQWNFRGALDYYLRVNTLAVGIYLVLMDFDQ
jgi:hypothetical protein